MRNLILSLCGVILAGCVTVENIGPRDISHPDIVLPMRFTSGESIEVRMLVFEDAGKTAICGYYEPRIGGNFERQLTDTWLQNAAILINGEKVASGSTIAILGIKDQGKISAPCYRTERAWSGRVSATAVDIVGGRVEVAF